MKKYLMHQDTVVAEFTVNQNQLQISSVKVMNHDLFPNVGTDDINSIRRWYLLRQSIHSRNDYRALMKFYGRNALTSRMLRSLQDCYWVKDENDETTWDDINPYHIETLNKDAFLQAMSAYAQPIQFDEESPNLTLLSHSKQFWFKHPETNELGILDANAQTDMHAYKLAQEHQLELFKPRSYHIERDNIFTFRPSSTNEQVEAIPFQQLYLETKDDDKNNSENLRLCCEKYNIPNWKTFIRNLLEFNKIAVQKIDLMDLYVLRDTNTLQYLNFDLL